ncbi:Integrator complex subunit 10, variant 2 [Basidiobolus ranarum]|uniref:Integrator complex subunit 10, variant 2 n=1 Tax=Basidiobolus ranarum TaxID=34480 RepID=A0ABR2W6S3_9FUNG
MNPKVTELVNSIQRHIVDGVFPLAISEVERGLSEFPSSVELQLLRHRVAVRQKRFTAAATYFNEIQRQFPSHELFGNYLQEVGNSVLQECQNEHLVFYRNAPKSTQKQLLISAAASFERSGEYLSACKLQSTLLGQFPELIPSYGPQTVNLALEGEKRNEPLPIVNGFRSVVVNSIIPTIFKKKVIIREFGTNDSQGNESTESLYIYREQFDSWLEIVQGYCLSNIEFSKLHELFLLMVKQCSLLDNGSDDPNLSTPDRFLGFLNGYPDALASELQIRFLISYFAHLAVNYYQVSSDRSKTNEESASIMIPLVPITSFGAEKILKRSKIEGSPISSTHAGVGKLKPGNRTDTQTYELLKLLMSVYKRGKHETNRFEEVLENTLSHLKVPFVVENAVLYARADIAIFDGLTSEAIPLYRELSSRLKEAWQTQQYIMNKVNSTQSADHDIILALNKIDMSMLKSRWSPIFPFRLIFSIGLCNLMEESYNEAITEFFAIVGAMPFKSLDRPVNLEHKRPGLESLVPEALATVCLEYIATGIEVK